VRQVQLTFVGGIDRGDAAQVAAEVGATPGWEALPVELGFHCERRGISDLLEGRVTLAGFRDAVAERWWTDRLERVVAAEALAAALDRLAADYAREPIAACRRLFLDLVAPFAESSGAAGLVEHSLPNLVHAPNLDRLFGEARFVHAVRDGREIAARAGDRTAGELIAGLAGWAADLREIDAGVRVREDGAAYGVWPDRLRVVVLGGDTAGDPGWGAGLSRRERRRVERRYARTLRELAADGVHCAPALIEARERTR
jgi:hypothetical protein